ncbi:hypothetical protein [Candidatus Neptunichlamydia sp. REUL1]|uniref:hypothetical protein n=1 Tax=Candidatus Neptunichlamydia sp. REUL1 TaxID=3064277 RepID=UPI00292DFCA3|nr:hypothetical protein [Candidatus Neptunochlamydia sp. REUL1]
MMTAAEAAGPSENPIVPIIPRRNIPPNSEPPFPPPASTPYRNTSTEQYNPAMPLPEAPGINWGAVGGGALAIGAGAAMGVALLAQATRGSKKKKRDG